jgi:hypothetical protein
VEVLRFWGEWTPPEVVELVGRPGVGATAVEMPVATILDENVLRLDNDGDLVALGALACLLTSILSAAVLVSVAAALF